MARKKRIECAICGKKVDFAYTSVLWQGKVRKVCSESCFHKAVNYGEENNCFANSVNHCASNYRVR